MSKPLYQLLPDVGVCIIDFSTLFLSRIRPGVFELMEQYNIPLFKKLDPSTKRLVKHHIIYTVCERIRKANAHGNLRTVIYAHKEEFEHTSNLPDVYIERVVWHALTDIEAKLPIRILFAKYSYGDFTNPHISSGVVKETKLALSKLAEKDFGTFTYDKIHKFTAKEGLTYLNKDYFQSLKSKLIMAA